MIRADRVEQRLDDLGLNPFSAARQAKLEPGYVRDILRDKIKEPGAAKLAALAAVLRCSPDYLMGLVEKPGTPPGVIKSKNMTYVTDMPIRFEVAAGNWVAVDEMQEEPLGSAPVALKPEYAGSRQWLERVRGDSMNRVFPDGALLHVVDATDAGYAPVTNDYVIVTRTRAQGAFIERSVKQVAVLPEGVELWPRSDNPRYQSPMSVTEGLRENEEAEVRIVGKVVGAYISF